MNNFKSSGPGGLRKRNDFIGGRPKSDANYGAKKSFGDKPRFGGNDRGGDRGGSRDGGRGGNDRGGDRKIELFKTTCTTCGKSCEVPFKPEGSKPVLCRDCFANKPDDRGGRERNDRPQSRPEYGGSNSAPRPDRGPSPDYKAFQQQVAALENKLNEVLEILKATQKQAKIAKVAAPAAEAEVSEAPAKVRKPKKEVVEKVAKKVVKKATKKAK